MPFVLKIFFSKNGIEVKWINPVVLWAGEMSPFDEEKGTLTLKNPATPVWKVEDIEQYIDEFLQSSHFKELKDEAIKLLTKAMESNHP